MMSTRTYRARFAMIGLFLLAGISGSPVLAATNIASNSTSQTVVNNNQTKQLIARNRLVGVWNLDKSRARFGHLTRVEQEKFDIFQNAIHNEGVSPKEAADRMGDADYKRLQGDQYQIRLSQRNRATFLVDNVHHIVTILQVGGHT